MDYRHIHISVLLLLTATVSRAQVTVPPPGANVSTPLKIGSLDVKVGWRTRAELWNWFDGGQGTGDYGFGHSQLRVVLGQRRPRFDWVFEGEQVAIVGLPDNAVAPAPLGQLGLGGTYYTANGNSQNNASAFVKQAYVQVKNLGRVDLKLGRFEFFDAVEAKSSDPLVVAIVQTRIAHRLISNFGFTAVQRTFDGAQFSWNAASNNVTAFAGRPTEGIFQVNGMSEVGVQSYYLAYNKAVVGGHGAGRLRLFGLGYIDARTNVVKTDNRPSGVRAADASALELGTWGADYVHVLRGEQVGTIDLVGWVALQTGSWGNLTQQAGAFVGEAGWQPARIRGKPWVSAGYSFGSGDSDPNDARHGTFFQLLTTPRQYARFPFYNMMNNEDAYVTLNLAPVKKLGVRSEFHRLRLANGADLWYQGGGVFQRSTFGFQGRPSNGDSGLATVWDLSADYGLSRFVSLTAYYAHAVGDKVIANVYPRNSTGGLAYLETIVRF